MVAQRNMKMPGGLSSTFQFFDGKCRRSGNLGKVKIIEWACSLPRLLQWHNSISRERLGKLRGHSTYILYMRNHRPDHIHQPRSLKTLGAQPLEPLATHRWYKDPPRDYFQPAKESSNRL